MPLDRETEKRRFPTHRFCTQHQLISPHPPVGRADQVIPAIVEHGYHFAGCLRRERPGRQRGKVPRQLRKRFVYQLAPSAEHDRKRTLLYHQSSLSRRNLAGLAWRVWPTSWLGDPLGTGSLGDGRPLAELVTEALEADADVLKAEAERITETVESLNEETEPLSEERKAAALAFAALDDAPDVAIRGLRDGRSRQRDGVPG
jgi:hypothetical protein